MELERKNHWEGIYAKRPPEELSWYQVVPKCSLELITATKIDHDANIIDVGAGASLLVDTLIDTGFNSVTVLDISSKAIQYAKERLGNREKNVTWIVTDVTEFKNSIKYNIWHDRAVFHFLTNAKDRSKYIHRLEQSLVDGGYVIIATFAIDGPEKCSGLTVQRYSSDKLSKELGESFKLIKSVDEIHLTPVQTEQKFTYSCFKKQVR